MISGRSTPPISRSGRMPLRLLALIALTAIAPLFDLAGCSIDPIAEVPMAAGEVTLGLIMSHSSRFWSDNFDRAAEKMFRRSTLLMDDPIRLVSYAPRPPAQGLEGRVVMQFAISPEGVPIEPRLIRVQGPTLQRPQLGMATLEAVQHWRFSAPVRDGEPTRFCCVRLVMDYTPSP